MPTMKAIVSALLWAGFMLVFRNTLPFAWTLRMLRPVYRIRLRQLRTRIWGATPDGKIRQDLVGCYGQAAETDSRTAVRPLSAEGCDPFTDTITWHHRATIDDCDFFGHLSNSSYPRNLDVARMYFASNRLADFLADGGWIPLASTSFTFHNEVPILTRYRIEMRIEAWSDKWLFVRNEYRGKNRQGKEVLFCTAITRHCFKQGRKTVAPWFVMAYCGYSSANLKGEKKSNAQISREVRTMMKVKGKNPLQAYERVNNDQVVNVNQGWLKADFWNVEQWEEQRKERWRALMQSFALAE